MLTWHAHKVALLLPAEWLLHCPQLPAQPLAGKSAQRRVLPATWRPRAALVMTHMQIWPRLCTLLQLPASEESSKDISDVQSAS